MSPGREKRDGGHSDGRREKQRMAIRETMALEFSSGRTMRTREIAEKCRVSPPLEVSCTLRDR